jgi:hypothetical protein
MTFNARIRWTGLAAILCLFTAVYSQAQVSTAAINGVVQDTSGAVVPGASITATQTETNYTLRTQSTDTGAFTLSLLPVGPYKILVEKKGFEKYQQTGILLTVGQTAVLQIGLQVGAESESVTVTAEAPAVESTQSTIQSTVEEKVVTDLPLNGRNPATLMNTVPGVTDATENITGATANISPVKEADATLSSQSAPTTNGVRPGGTYFSLDGAGNVDPWGVIGGPFPNPDATQEFEVVTGSYGARYVSAPGGAVNIITKSGTNKIHGSVFEFVRNGFFNARNYFATTPDILKRNQYGAAIGGPILKDKMFYFGSYQGTIIRDTMANVEAVPTQNELNGNFVDVMGNPVVVPGPLMSTVGQNALSYWPLPTTGSFAAFNTPNNSTEQQFTGKVDYNIGQDRLFARLFTNYDSVPAADMVNNNVFTATSGEHHDWVNLALGNTWSTKSGKWILDTRASVLRVHILNFGTANDQKYTLTDLGAINFTSGVHGAYPLLVAGTTVASTPSWTQFPRNSVDIQQDVMYNSGKHEASFGADLRFLHFSEYNESGQNSVQIFTGAFSMIALNMTPQGPVPLVDGAFADMLTGHPTVFIQHDGFIVASHGNMYGFYGEDKYRLSSRLTLTGGVRWDPYLPFVSENGRMDCWAPGSQSSVFVNAPKGIVYPGEAGCEPGGTTTKLNNVQPRVGLAYRVDNSGKTALRAGWGMYSMQFPLASFLGLSAPPWVRSIQLTNPFMSMGDPYGSNGLTNPFSGGFLTGTYNPPSDVSFAEATAAGMAMGAIDRNFRPAYVQQWTVSLQHQLSTADSIEVAYIGTEGVHLSQSADLNLPVNSPSIAAETAHRPYASEGLTNIYSMESNTNSGYTGLNATFRHRSRGGLDLVSGFNWSKCMDYGSTPGSTEANTILENNHAFFYGRCNFDQNLSFRNTIVWTSPRLAGQQAAVRQILGSWIATGLVVTDAGQPFSVTDSADNSYTGAGFDRADSVSGKPVYVNGKLNSEAFAENAAGTFGNTVRNAYRSPANLDFDFGLAKIFNLGERFKLNFRSEAFNLFNHPNLFPPAADLNSPGFGESTVARDPRILQFSLKLLF